MITCVATTIKVTVVLKKIAPSGQERFMPLVVCLILESESEDSSGKNSSTKGTSDGKKTQLRSCFQCSIELYLSEHDP